MIMEFLFLNQSMHRDIVKKFGMEGKSHAQTPMSTFVKINSNPTSKCVDSTLYRSMIGSLLYITATRLDISFNVSVCARFQSNPKKSHLIAVNRILKYLSVISDCGIWY